MGYLQDLDLDEKLRDQLAIGYLVEIPVVSRCELAEANHEVDQIISSFEFQVEGTVVIADK